MSTTEKLWLFIVGFWWVFIEKGYGMGGGVCGGGGGGVGLSHITSITFYFAVLCNRVSCCV